MPYPTTDVFIATVRAALPTTDAPDLFTWWSTYRMKELIDQGLLAPTTELWDKHKDEYSEGLRNAFTFDGEAYGYSYTQEYWPVWYNKDVFAQYNLEAVSYTHLGLIPYIGWFFFSWLGYVLAFAAWILGIVAIVKGCNCLLYTSS